jgi:hypothetical protein
MWKLDRITNLLLLNNFVKVKDIQADYFRPVKVYVSGDLVAFGDLTESIEYHIYEVGDWERCSEDFHKLLKKPMLMAKKGDLISIYKLDDKAYLIEYTPSDDEGNSYKCIKVIKHKDYGEVCDELLGYFYVKGFIKIADDDEVQYLIKNLNNQSYKLIA